MKFCVHCGAEVANAAVVCVKCGCSLPNTQTAGVNPNDAPNVGYIVLGFFLPLVGVILFLVWHKSSPQKAISCGKGVAINYIVSAAVGIIVYILLIPMILASMSDLSSIFNL
jgi:uncharacterized membrane protein YvbJ